MLNKLIQEFKSIIAFESFNPDSIDYQNKAVLLDEKNKETFILYIFFN